MKKRNPSRFRVVRQESGISPWYTPTGMITVVWEGDDPNQYRGGIGCFPHDEFDDVWVRRWWEKYNPTTRSWEYINYDPREEGK